MKLETFEKASEIKSKINYLLDLESVIANASCGHNRLAAINTDHGDICIMNEEPLTQEMLQAFKQIINAKVALLRKEFEEL